MKTLICIFIAFIFAVAGHAQIGIGTTTPHSSAALDISDSTRGLLIPRMSMIRRQAINNPAEGLLVYQTDNAQGFWAYNGSAWVNLVNSATTTNADFNQVSSDAAVVVLYTNATTSVFTGSAWVSTALSGPPLGSLVVGSIAAVYTSTAIHVFSNGAWSTQTITGTPIGITGVHDMIVVSTTTNLYGYAKNDLGSYAWFIQPVLGTVKGSAIAKNTFMFTGNCVVIYTESFAYAFTRSQGYGSTQWYPQAIAGTPLGASGTGAQVIVYTTTHAYSFDFDWFRINPIGWFPVTLAGTGIGVSPE